MPTGTTRASRSRIAFVAAALVVFLEGGGTRTSNNHGLFLGVEAFVLPSSPLTPGLLPNVLLQQQQQQQQQQEEDSIFPLRSFKYIKGESSYGDLVDGTVTSGMIGGMLAGSGSTTSISGFGGLTTKSSSRSMGTNSLASAKRRSFPAWWSSKSGFSRTTPTTLLAAGSIESWPVLEADDIQILVRKGEAIDDEDLDDDEEEEEEYDDSGYPIVRKPSSSVKATLERWERDIALEVVGLDGYPMIGNEMQPTPQNNYYYSGNNYGEENNDRCTQKIEFNVANGDLYPFSGTVSVPPPLTVEDSTGNQQTVMMVLNNPDEEEEEDGDAGFGNALLPGSSSSSSSSSLVRQQGGNTKKRSKRRGKTLEATIEPLYKSPDEKYAEAQVQQQQQYEFGYDEYGNEIYNPGSEKTTIPSQGYQSFQVDATDPASGKIKISLERDENSGGSGLGGAFRSAMGGGGSGSSSSSNSDVSAARVEIYHGFRDLDGNYHSYNPEEDDKRISLDVSTMHPSFSSVVDTMPSELLAKHALSVPDANNYDPRVSAYQPYLEVRIVNTGGAALKAGVESYMPFYKSRSQQEKEAQQRERRREQFQRRGTTASLPPATTVKADDPFLLVDSAQSSTSSRRIHNTFPNQSQKSYVSAKRTRRFDNTRAETLQGFGGNSNKFMETRESGVKPDVPGGSARLGGTSESRKKFARTEQRQFSLPSYNDSNSPQRQRNNKKKSDYDRYGMGTSLNDRVPESPLSPDDDGRSTKLGSGQTIDTIATTPGGSVSGTNSHKLALTSFGGNGGSISGMQSRQGREQQLRDGGYYQNSQAQTSRVLGNGNSIGDGVMNGRPPSAGTSPFAAYGSVSETNTNRYNGNNSNNRLAGNGGLGSGTNKQNNIGAFAGNGRVIGDGVIKGQNSTPGGFSGYSSGNVILGNDKSFSSGSGSGSGSFNNNGFSGQSNNSNRLGGGTKPFGSYNGNSNNDSFGGNTMNNYSNDVSDSPFGNMGRPPQTTGNSKNPFATMNGESSDTSNNSSPFGESPSNNFSSNNSFNTNSNSNSNGFNSNNSFGGGGMGSPQRPQQPNAAGRASAMKNPFSGLNGSSSGNVAKSSPFGKTGGANSNAMGSQNSSPFGSIGSPSTTAMRSRNFDSDYVEDEAESSSSENPLMGFAKSLVKGITGS